MTKIINIGNVPCGADKLFLISGPCVIEEEDIMFRTAEKLADVAARLDIPLIYKSSFLKDNRSSVEYYSGPGLEEGLKILNKIKERFDIPVVTDIHFPGHVDAVAEVVDMLQVPAYLCMQTSLLIAAANTGKPVNIKHGQFIAPENMVKPLQKLIDLGNSQVLLTERGYTFGYNDLIVDPRSFYHLKQTGYPVVFDVTHSIRKYGIPSADPSGGSREFLEVLARAGVAAGVDGLFVETHPKPAIAKCDAASQMCIDDLEEFMKPLIEIHNLEVAYRAKKIYNKKI